MKRLSVIKINIIALILILLSYYIYNYYATVNSMSEGAVAVFKTAEIEGEVVVSNYRSGVKLVAEFRKLPSGKHGFHIHKAGDLRGEGCQGLCEHYDIGKNSHGGDPNSKGERHTGDLGNIELVNGKFEKEYYIKGITVKDLWGRSAIVHEDEDDLGKGLFEDSLTTGHSGKRIGCAIFGRVLCGQKDTTQKRKTLKNRK